MREMQESGWARGWQYAGRLVHQRLFLGMWLVITLFGGCANAQHASSTATVLDARVQVDPRVSGGTTTPGSEPAQADFSAAVAAFDARQFTQAYELFELFARNYPSDPAALHARFMAVRSLISAGDFQAARTQLRAMDTPYASLPMRAHARAYLAFIEKLSENPGGARTIIEGSLRELPDMHVTLGVAWSEDVPWLASLLADTRIRQRDFAGALQDLEVVQLSAADDVLRDWSSASAMTIAREVLSDEAIDTILRAPSTFQRAAVLATKVQRLLRTGDVPGATAAFQTHGIALLAHDLGAEYAAIQNTLALRGSVVSPMYGLAISLTGPDRRAGRAALGGVLLAQQSFDGKERLSDLWIEDTGGYADGARGAVERLCARGVPVIIGPIETGLAAVAREAAHACGAVYLGLDVAATSAAAAYTMSFHAPEEARQLVNVGRDQGAIRWYLVSETPPAEFFQTLGVASRAEIARAGGTLVGTSTLDVADLQRSSREVAQQVRGANADAIIFALSSRSMMVLASYLTAAGVWPKSGSGRAPLWLGSSFAWGSDLARAATRDVEGMYFVSWMPHDRAMTMVFQQRFQAVFGREAGALEAFAFDAATLARQMVLERGVRDGNSLERRLREGHVLEGATGTWTWQREGLAHPPVLQRVVGGTPVSL